MSIIAAHKPDIENNRVLKLLKKHTRVTDGLRGNAFWVHEPDQNRPWRFAFERHWRYKA